MRINVKLMGTLRNKLQVGSQGGKTTLEVASGAASGSVVDQLGMSDTQVHLVLVNGEMDKDRTRVLAEGDEVTLFPPVAGGQGNTGGFFHGASNLT